MSSVAVITRTKNRPILLRRALESVLKQTYKDLVWVIVNDGGDTTEVEKIAKTARGNNVEVVVIHNEKSIGMEAASNKGIRAVESKYIVIHDDDDSWNGEFLEETVGFLEKSENRIYKGVVTRSFRVDEKIINTDKCQELAKYPFNNDLENIYVLELVKYNLYPPISFLYKREVFEQIGGYNENLPVLGDWDFNLRFILHSDIGVIKRCLANYHHRVQSDINIYGNSIIQGIEQHKKYDAIIRNRLLREDVLSNRIGLGYLVNTSKFHENSISGYKRIIKSIKRYGVKGIIKKIRYSR